MNGAEDGRPARPRRRDFERNREAILKAADDCFVELGPKTPIDTVAKRAGVGPATIYRHFPTRADLEAAVFEVRLATYAEAIEQAQELEDPHAAFRRTIHALVELQSRDRSFRDLVGGDQERLAGSAGLPRFATALFAAFTRAREEKVIRAEVQNEDVFLLLMATEGIARSAAAHSPAALRRVADIALDGICGERTELSGSPLTWVQLFESA